MVISLNSGTMASGMYTNPAEEVLKKVWLIKYMVPLQRREVALAQER
jgi:hypothetical protein